MLVVASELWVGTLEGWVSASLWLLDTVVGFVSIVPVGGFRRGADYRFRASLRGLRAYPLR